MTKEKSQGDEFGAIGKQTMARAYSAMDYYFDHLKKTVASAPSGGTEFGEKVKACAEQNISATQEFVRELSYAKDIQDMCDFRWNSCARNWKLLASRLRTWARLI